MGNGTASDLLELQNLIDLLETKHFRAPKGIPVDDSMRRARTAVEKGGLYSANWKWVPEPYYNWGLERRRQELGARSTKQLCKSLLMENKKNTGDGNDPTNPKFVLVVVQYAATLDVKKLSTAIRARRPVSSRLDDSQFDFRIASSEDNDRITGYTHNSVTPFGLQLPVPILIAQDVVKERFFWMGGGHIHLKLGMSVHDFCEALNPIIADISQPRIGSADEAIEDA